MPAIEYRDVPNGYVYLYEREGWEVVERGDYATRMRTAVATSCSADSVDADDGAVTRPLPTRCGGATLAPLIVCQ